MISIKGIMEEQERVERESYRQQCQDFFETLPKRDLLRLAEFFAWVIEQAPGTTEEKPHVFRGDAT